MIIGLLDDDPVMGQLIRFNLAEAGHRVVCLVPGVADLPRLTHAVVDWFVPLSWEHARDALIRKCLSRGVPVCVYSANAGAAAAVRSAFSGAEFLEKSTDQSNLLDWISRTGEQ